MKKKRLSDEAQAGIACFIWEFFFMLAAVIDTPLVWVILLFVTIIEAIIVYFDWRSEQAENEAKRNRQLFSRQTENYLKTIYESGAADRDE